MSKTAGPRKQVPTARRSKAEHVIVDGSNLATEGRSRPSLAQLNEAVLAFMDEHPKTVITVIVDATFGHRIDPKEVAAFDKAVEHNELVTPPAGTVGRGDAFVLNIAEKAGAAILSNDSYQEFHGQYPWLFDDGRLIGGKPVPNIGWVFVERVPVRGDKSRRAVRDAQTADEAPVKRGRAKASAAAMKPMPIPKAPPPGATLRARAKTKETAKRPAKQAESRPEQTRITDGARTLNEILPFLQFVENNPVGSVVEGRVESYSSHGAYVTIGDVVGYVPLRLLGSPPPRSAREVMKLGDDMAFEVVDIIAGRRSINLRLSDRKIGETEPAKKAMAKKAVAKKASPKKAVAKKAVPEKVVPKRIGAKKAGADKVPVSKTPVKKAVAKKTVPKTAGPKKTVSKTAGPKKSATNKAPAKKVAVKTTGAKKAAAKKPPAKGSSVGKANGTKAAAKPRRSA